MLPNSHAVQYVEVNIPLPYGHLAAKWWGRQDVRPIVCLHGWQDNSGSFDALIPLLPQHVGYLAIDLPGNGLSSFLPEGILDTYIQHLHMLDSVFRCHFKWPKVSIIGHSMMGRVMFVYSAIFPTYVDMVVSIDGLKPEILRDKYARLIFNRINQYDTTYHKNNRPGVEPSTYSHDTLIDKMVLATDGSITRESAPYLLQRGSKQSQLNPDRYYFSRDFNRLKYQNVFLFTTEVNIELANRIRCPYLFLWGNSKMYAEYPEHVLPVIKAMQSVNPRVEILTLKSGHYMHLVEPEKIIEPVSRFINRYRPDRDNISTEKSKL